MPGGAPRGLAAPPARPGGRKGMNRRPRAAEPSPPARRRNEPRVKVDRGNPLRRVRRAADGGGGGERQAPKVPAAPHLPPRRPSAAGSLQGAALPAVPP